jgi:hypothetical protein
MGLTLRLVKGSELTYQELDDNFTYLSSSIAAGGGPVNISGYVTTSSFNAYTGSSTSQFAGTASFATSASFASNATSASYVRLIQGPNIQINYTAAGIAISGTISGISGVGGLTLATGSGANQIRLLSASVLVGDEIIVPFATSASFLTTDITRIATGSLTASVTPSQFSVVSGSVTEFLVTGRGVTMGSSGSDAHSITGSVRITGSLDIRNSLGVTGSTQLRNLPIADQARTGSNVVPNSTGWTGINWDGNNTTGFYRTTLDTNFISCSTIPVTVGQLYALKYTISGNTGGPFATINITVGGKSLGNISSNGVSSIAYILRPDSTNITAVLTPTAIWNGTASIDLSPVTASTAANLTLLPSTDNIGVEHRVLPNPTGATIIGYQAGRNLISITGGGNATFNTFIGYQAGEETVYNIGNTLIGYQAGNLTQANVNTFVGYAAGFNNLYGNSNVYLGAAAGYSATPSSGSQNIAIGLNALGAAATSKQGSNNIAIGTLALGVLTTGASNIAIGVSSGNTLSSGVGNVMLGQSSGLSLTTGNYNLLAGHDAGRLTTTGVNNVALGLQAGFYSNGSNNIGIGFNAHILNISGSDNIFIGKQAGEWMQTIARSGSIYTASLEIQSGNTVVGTEATQHFWGGSRVTAVGYRAGTRLNTSNDGASGTIPTGSNLNNSIFIGYQAGYYASPTTAQLSSSNEIVIGYDQRGFGSNTTTIGANSTSASYLYGDLIVTGTLGSVLDLPFQSTLPSNKPTGSIALSGSGGTFEGMYVYNGTTWTKIGP